MPVSRKELLKQNEAILKRYNIADREMTIRGLDIERFILIVQRHADDLSINFLNEYNEVMHPYIVRNTEENRKDQDTCGRILRGEEIPLEVACNSN